MSTLIPLLQILALGGPLLLGLLQSVPTKERRRLAVLMFVGFALRLLVATVFDVIPELRIFHEDAEGYEYFGTAIATHWLGQGPEVPFALVTRGASETSYPGFLVLCASLYYVLGCYRLVVTAFTSLCGAVTIFMVHRLAGRIFHPLVAYRAAAMTTFFPSMVLWSAMALKDPVMILLITVALDSALELRTKFHPRSVILFVAAALGMWFIRFYVVYFLAIAAFTSILLARGRMFITKTVRQLAIVGIVVLIFSALGVTSGLIHAAEPYGLDRISSYRHGMAMTANSGFSVDADLSTPGGALAFLPIGMSVLLFGPFPWQMTSLRPLITLPEMLVWWTMIPSLWRGIRFAVKREFSSSIPILVFGGSLTGLYSLTLGNVGAAFRQRAQVFVFLFIFVALGHFVHRCRRRGIDPDLLRNDVKEPVPAP